MALTQTSTTKYHLLAHIAIKNRARKNDAGNSKVGVNWLTKNWLAKVGCTVLLAAAFSLLFNSALLKTFTPEANAATKEDLTVIVKDDSNNEICTLETDAEKCDLAAEEVGSGIIALDVKNKAIQLNDVDSSETVLSFSASFTLKADSVKLAGIQQVDSSQTTTFESGSYELTTSSGAALDIAGALKVGSNVSILATGTSSGVYAAGNIVLDQDASLTGVTTSAKGIGIISNGISLAARSKLEGRSDLETPADTELNSANSADEDAVPADAPIEDDTTIGIAVGWGNSFIGGGSETDPSSVKAAGNTGISLSYPEDGSYPTGDVSFVNTTLDISAKTGAGLSAKQVNLGQGTRLHTAGASAGIFATAKLTLDGSDVKAENGFGGLYSVDEVSLRGSTKLSVLAAGFGILGEKVSVEDQSEVNIDPMPLEGNPFTAISGLTEVNVNLLEEGFLQLNARTANTTPDPTVGPITDETPAETSIDAPVDATGDDVNYATGPITMEGAALTCGDTALVQRVNPGALLVPIPLVDAASDAPADTAGTSEDPAAADAPVETPTDAAPQTRVINDCSINIGAKTKMTPSTSGSAGAELFPFLKSVYKNDVPAETVSIEAVPVPWYVSLWRTLGVFLILIILLILALLGWIAFLIFHKKPALLVMNLQNAAVTENVYKIPLASAVRTEFAAQIEAYIRKYRKRYKKVYLVQETHQNNAEVFEHFKTWGEHALAGTPSAELLPSINALTEFKNVSVLNTGLADDGYDAFKGTTLVESKKSSEELELGSALKQAKVKRVKLIGLPLDYAILKTALEGVKHLGEGKVEVLTNLTLSVTDREKIIAKLHEKGIVIK